MRNYRITFDTGYMFWNAEEWNIEINNPDLEDNIKELDIDIIDNTLYLNYIDIEENKSKFLITKKFEIGGYE